MSAIIKFLIIGFVITMALISMNMADDSGEKGTTKKGTTTKAPPTSTPAGGCKGSGNPLDIVAIVIPALIGLVQQLLLAVVAIITVIVGALTGNLIGLGVLQELLENLPGLGGVPGGDGVSPDAVTKLIEGLLSGLLGSVKPE